MISSVIPPRCASSSSSRGVTCCGSYGGGEDDNRLKFDYAVLPDSSPGVPASAMSRSLACPLPACFAEYRALSAAWTRSLARNACEPSLALCSADRFAQHALASSKQAIPTLTLT